MAHCPKIANSIRSAPAQCLSAALCYVGQPQSFFYPCNKLLFFKGLLHGVFSCHFIANIPFHKMRLFVPKWLKFKLPAMVQKIFARTSILLKNIEPELSNYMRRCKICNFENTPKGTRLHFCPCVGRAKIKVATSF